MTRLRTLSTGIAWTAWSAAAFARAAAEGRPVLLSIAAAWCDACREMDRTTFADPDVAACIHDRFLPVRVDPDARPDIAERYTLGGWPTTAFLSPEGQVLGGGTFISLERMPGVLRQVGAAFAGHQPRQGPAPAAAAAAAPASPAPSALEVLAAYDAVHGGFGTAPKFPHVAAVRLALAGSAAGGRTGRDEEIIVRTLDAMGWGGLFDEAEGGFFHYAAGADWSAPHPAKRLDDQAALIRLYLDAGESLGLTRFTARAADTLGFVQSWLADPEGGWHGARHAGDTARPATPFYADANAAMVSAALHAARVFEGNGEDEGLRQFALTSLERVLLACYKPGDGVSHYHDGARQGRGLLAGQVAMAGACLDAHDATGLAPYLMMAEELMHYAVRELWDDARGAFRDRAADPDEPAIGLLAEPLYPFAGNCAAVMVLRRLTAESGDHDFAARADRTLASLEPLAAPQGLLAAHYLLAKG